MSPEQKQRREAILRADDKDEYAVVELLTRSYVEDFPDDGIISLRRGRTLTKLCRYVEADANFENAFKTNNAELLPFIWTSKAESLERRGQLKEAEECYVRANKLRPNESWILIPLARATWLRGDLKLAEARFREAIAIERDEDEQDRDEALFNFGGALVALGKLEAAADCYREALVLSPDYEIAQLRLDDVEHALELQREHSKRESKL